jgi:hypothetical protein
MFVQYCRHAPTNKAIRLNQAQASVLVQWGRPFYRKRGTKQLAHGGQTLARVQESSHARHTNLNRFIA